MRVALAALFGALVAGGPPIADAQPRRASVGPYAEAGLGATGFVGAGRQYSRIGPSFALRGGTDLFRWLSLGGRLDLSTHEATVPPPPEGEYYQLYGAAAEARLGLPVGPMAIYADGGAGLSLISTNVLAKVNILEPGQRLSPMVSAGGGVEYQLQNRHYALGVAGHWTMYLDFGDSAPISTVTGRAYLRYTY